MALAGNQRRHLRALGHHLNPVVQVGHQGVTDGVVGAMRVALHDHELVKVKFAQAVDEREAAIAELAERTGAEWVQTLGRTALLYLRRPKKPTIELPPPNKKARDAEAAPAASDDEDGEEEAAPADEDADE